ncbi:uncharacterized protein MKK02DRAFT_27830 [Dioszegia hungarica]|uniref:Uncharacterized protein n=1 Tax=Dioszegia hungarica TaxID=4972 RepID=A0AA38H962_9TREE|nr:uncharacterized protein MKK02DRAFT_27830 [Dioszegia hungarica]KAI9634659.1 hypothetical protein MKK02DRAFT_27830 [Dioszegia hungarica]
MSHPNPFSHLLDLTDLGTSLPPPPVNLSTHPNAHRSASVAIAPAHPGSWSYSSLPTPNRSQPSVSANRPLPPIPWPSPSLPLAPSVSPSLQPASEPPLRYEDPKFPDTKFDGTDKQAAEGFLKTFQADINGLNREWYEAKPERKNKMPFKALEWHDVWVETVGDEGTWEGYKEEFMAYFGVTSPGTSLAQSPPSRDTTAANHILAWNHLRLTCRSGFPDNASTCSLFALSLNATTQERLRRKGGADGGDGRMPPPPPPPSSANSAILSSAGSDAGSSTGSDVLFIAKPMCHGRGVTGRGRYQD